ncbi:MAG: hypothetical protein LHV68_04165 [Elusimicrobia bacterium]|nr:hypothetical protein [Candidatus Liberimonas magnetica]
MNYNNDKPSKKAWVISAHMGLGHLRAAYPLKDIADNRILIDGSKEDSEPQDYKIWNLMRAAYYFMSRAKEIPLIGDYIYKLLCLVQEIPSYYPKRDLSKPIFPLKFLVYLIKNRGLSNSVVKLIGKKAFPVISTFYSSAIALDILQSKKKENFLLICDSDFNRIWVPEEPKESNVKYFAPCTRVKRRLLSYGVPEGNIFLTGFPLPKENIGSEEGLEILKEDLFNRLIRLDPDNYFFNIHGKTVEYYLGKKQEDFIGEKYFDLTFAVGGSGVQVGTAKRILKSFKDKIVAQKVRINLSAGIREDVYRCFIDFLYSLNLKDYMNKNVRIIYSPDPYEYFDMFNKALRTTDVLWTKPSELVFYCALGIPILMAPSVGTHEALNKRWLQDIHTGIKPAGSVDHSSEWLFDLRKSGILAEAAWDGFLKARKLGTYKIEHLVFDGTCNAGNSPLQR